MKTLAAIASALIAASAILLPLPATAATKEPAGHHAHAHAESAFPMKVEAFKKLVDGKVERVKAQLARDVAKRGLSHEQKADLDKTLEGALKDLHAAVEKVGADGLVSKDEAKRIKDLSEQLRAKVRAELKGKHANAKGKGQKPAKGKNGKAKPAKKPDADKTNQT